MGTRPIYLDHHATTPVDPRVLEAMRPFWTERFGNPASRHHRYGWEAAEALEEARSDVAALIGAAEPRGVVFTSGATESLNLALKGLVERRGGPAGVRLVLGATEHAAVLDVARRLGEDGAEVAVVPVDADGLVDPADVEARIDDRTALVAVMWANNEIGAIGPVAEVGRLCRARGVPFVCDATQAVGKVPVDVEATCVDLLALSAHKFHGPKGAGALWVRPRTRLAPLLHGGGHERGLRSGTPNVPGIVGLGAACRIARAEAPAEAARLGRLRDRLRDLLFAEIDGVRLVGPDPARPGARLPGNLCVVFDGADAESLLARLPDVAVSSGAACASARREPSHVLAAIGCDRDSIRCSIRFGLGRFTTEEEIDRAARRVVEEVRRVRALSPLSRGAGGI